MLDSTAHHNTKISMGLHHARQAVFRKFHQSYQPFSDSFVYDYIYIPIKMVRSTRNRNDPVPGFVINDNTMGEVTYSRCPTHRFVFPGIEIGKTNHGRTNPFILWGEQLGLNSVLEFVSSWFGTVFFYSCFPIIRVFIESCSTGAQK